MGTYKLSKQENPDKIFIINRSEVEGRIEAEYYKPSLRLLEYKIREKTSKKLKDFSLKMASGATPSITEEDKYYSDKENGIPFLRVQNLQTNGELLLDDVKHINKTTHQTMLKRSQVAEHDLLIKITGVGRMAIASVAPKGFVGNTNQHMVVMKTKDEDTSQYLSKYLNLDIVEKLASRRSTGATRPALDYPALKSIPIVEGLSFDTINKAENLKKINEDLARQILNEIDALILDELNFKLPEKKDGIENRIFITKLSEVGEDRIDPAYNSMFYKELFEKINNDGRFVKFKSLINIITKGETPLWRGDSYLQAGIPFLRVQNIGDGEIVGDLNYINETVHLRMKRSKLFGGELLYTMAGSIGIAAIYPKGKGEANINQAIAKIVLKDNSISDYLIEILNSSICRHQAYRFLTTSAQPNINFEQIKAISIPIIESKQRERLIHKIRELRNKAKSFIHEGNQIVKDAKSKIEKQLI